MAVVDELMSRCPLKHEIRVNFWSPFIKKLKKTPISYLTLYSPPLMDVKYFEHKGFIESNNGVFTNVVGVTVDKEAFADSNTSLNYRLDLLLPGNINDLLSGSNKSEIARQLDSRFPFDVINLDYTDALHRYSLSVELSPHIQAIETVLKKQKDKDAFVLFLTTKVNAESYNMDFLNYLKQILDDNIASTNGFAEKLQKECGCKTAAEVMSLNSNNFFAISLLKFILLFLKDYGYELKDAGIKWLIRDEKAPVRHLLHLALSIKRFIPKPAKARKSIGKRENRVEESAVKFIKKEYSHISESSHFPSLFDKHSKEIENFNNLTFELKVPDPI